MTYRRTLLRTFALANDAYANATVTFYQVDDQTLARKETLIELFTDETGDNKADNPYTLDSRGKFNTPVYFEEDTIAVISNSVVDNHTTGIIAPFAKGWRGDYETGKYYLEGQIVKDGANGDNSGSYYFATTHFYSEDWTTDVANGYLALAIDVSEINSNAVAAALGATFALSSVSTTSLTIADSGSFSAVIEANRAIDIGSYITFALRTSPVIYWMSGTVTAYNSDTGDITVSRDAAGDGSGTYADWTVTVSGRRGVTGATGATGPAGSMGAQVRVPRTSNTVLGAANTSNSIVYSGSGGFTQTFEQASTLGANWWCDLTNQSTGVITLDPDSSETIDGQTTIKLYPGDRCRVQCNGTNLVTTLRGRVGTPFVTRTSNTKLVTADNGIEIAFSNVSGFTQTFDPAATLGAGWLVLVRNVNTGNITLDPDSSETINGASTLVLQPNEAAIVSSNGSNLIAHKFDAKTSDLPVLDTLDNLDLVKFEDVSTGLQGKMTFGTLVNLIRAAI